MKRGVVVLILLTSVFNLFLHSQQSQDEMQLLKRVSETYRGLGSYEIRAVVITDQHLDETRTVTEVPLIMAEDKPDKFRIESKHPFMGSMKVSDGKTRWEYTAMGHQYTKKPASISEVESEDGPWMPANYVHRYRQLAEKATAARLLREETLPSQGEQVRCAVVEVEFGDDAALKKTQESPHILWIDKQKALVLQETWESKMNMMGVASETKTTVTYKTIHIGQPVADVLFSFTPPVNAREVSELTRPGAPPRRAQTEQQPGVVFTLSTFEGEKISLSDFKGKTVLLDFWATWCVPCRESMPMIEKLNSSLGSKGLVALAVDYGEEPEVVKGYLAHNPSSLRQLLDANDIAAHLYNVNSVPAFILISKDGKVTYRSSGFGDDTEAGLRAALKVEGLE